MNEDGKIIIGTKVDTTGVKKGVKDIENIVDDESISMFDTDSDLEDLGEIEDALDDVGDKTKAIGGKFNTVLGNITSKLLGVSRGVGSLIVALVRGLGASGILVAIGSIVGFIVLIINAIKRATTENEQIISKIQIIKTALKNLYENLLKPIIDIVSVAINKILNGIIKVLGVIGGIIKFITGKDIFKNSGVGKVEDSLKASDKSAKSLKKTLTSFDEMNVLNDTSASGAGGIGGVASGVESIDLSSITDKASKTVEWLTKIKDKIIAIKDEILKLGDWSLFILGVNQVAEGIKKVFEGLKLQISGIWKIISGIFTLDLEKIKEGIKEFAKGTASIFEGLGLIIQGVFNTVYGFIVGIFTTVKNWIIQNFIQPLITNFLEFTKKIPEYFSNAVSKLKVFLRNFGTIAGEVTGNAFKAAFNGIMYTLEKLINIPIKAINLLIDTINAIPGISMNRLTEFKLPRLASGGIVNNPGKGVMMGNYIAGERGAEAVIPLDNATMDRLGQAIARHMNITNDNKIYMNARQIARQMSVTNAEHDFAFNS